MKTKSPNHYTATLVDVIFCFEHRVAQAIATKRSYYKLLHEAQFRQGHTVPEVAVVVICVRGSVPTSTLLINTQAPRPEPETGGDSFEKLTSPHVNTCVGCVTLAEPWNY